MALKDYRDGTAYRKLDRECPCGRRLDTWDVRCSKAVGLLQDSQHICVVCLAEYYEVSVDYFVAYLKREFGMEPCLGS